MAIVPGGGDEEFHSFHHSQNRGNYATWLRIWDSLFGTDKEYLLAKSENSYGIQSRKAMWAIIVSVIYFSKT